MPKERLVALWAFLYDTKQINKGDVFEASKEDAKWMLARGSVERETQMTSKTPSKRRYQRRDMRADS